MKKHIIFFSLIAISLAACNKEDELTPSGIKENYFAVPGDAQDEESVLRRAFYERNGVHLLFNDTLRHELRGTYEDNTPYWYTETIDLGYAITSQDASAMEFEYITDIEAQRDAVNIVETYFLPHFAEILRPYSMLLVNDLQIESYGTMEENTFYKGNRCIAINVGAFKDASPSEIDALCGEMFYGIIYNTFRLEDALFADFYAYSQNYYNAYYPDISGFPTEDPEKTEQAHALGFITMFTLNFVSASRDLKDFMQALFYNSEEDFHAQWADYPVILDKYDTLKRIVEEQGFIF